MSGSYNESGRAEALELALTNRGSSSAVADREMADLIELAHTVDEVASQIRPSDEFRARSRQRLLMHMARSARQQRSLRPSVADRVRWWAARFAAGLGALTIAGAAAASASASALPGDALYPVKRVTEVAALQLAPTDAARQDLLLHQADTRLDETTQLLREGRDGDASTAAAQYEQTLAALPTGSNAELTTDQARLSELLQTAPGPARARLERALSATERHTNAARPSVPTADNASLQGASSDRVPLNVEPDVPAGKDSDAPPPPEIEDSNPTRQGDAKPAASTGNAAPRGNAAQPATSQPPPSAPERSVATPRRAPPGRGRP
jgi:uncharacterized protein DUF5667